MKVNPVSITTEDMQMRLITRFVNEAAFCLQDEIIRNPVDGDIGELFSISFFVYL
jgi:enoyl-CoA hydratase/long-chain 3-hydroxyacyl-CoA dehydrogenase